jgi:hypothetical protein
MAEFTVLEDQIRECFGRVVYSHKAHEKMADACTRTLRRYKLAQIFVGALTTSGVVSIVFTDNLWLKLATAAVSLVSLWLSGYTKNIDPGGSAEKHREVATALWDVRESYLSLLTDLRRQSISDNEAIQKRDALQKKLGVVYRSAPRTNDASYRAAGIALRENEEFTFSDKEIDVFLPSLLRKVNIDGANSENC